MMMYGWDGWGWGGWILMALAMSVFWVLIITGVVISVRYVSGGNARSKQQGAPRAEDVLAERFARGDIDEDEFRSRMAAIHEHRAS